MPDRPTDRPSDSIHAPIQSNLHYALQAKARKLADEAKAKAEKAKADAKVRLRGCYIIYMDGNG